MKRLALLISAILLTAPALGQETTATAPQPEVTNSSAAANARLLWCASAFYWLAGSAEDSGDAEEAETYDRWSKRLLNIASTGLTNQGVLPNEIEALIATYDEQALVDLSGDSPPYDVAACPALLGEFR